MSVYKKLVKELKQYLEPDKIALTTKAYELAESAHGKQRRHSGDAYITHPVAVAAILAALRLDYETIIAAILHDVLEDTAVEKHELVEQFGEGVAELVDGVSKLTLIEFESRAQKQAENFRKMILAMTRDIRVIIIKLADRLHNMRTLDAVPQEKRGRVATETLEIYAPIANRLGMHAFRLEYEELGFSALYPMRYRVLKRSVKKARGNRKGILKEIEANLKTGLKEAKLLPSELVGREKHIYSIFKKMRTKQLSFSEIMDIYGFRVLVEDRDMCYRVLGVLHSLYKPLPHRFKDYIAIPKANGYQSLHTTLFGPYGVPIEIQIRTFEMDHMAESGIAAHWLYKADSRVCNEAQERARQWIQGILEMQQKSAGSSLEFIENVKIDLFPDEVYVFTPKGNIMELPNGATPIDFAYAVHSEVGNTCIAAKIDRRLVPLSTRLVSGQTIEVMTAQGARPNPAWLNFVRTGKARSNIRHYLKTQRRNEAIVLGKRLVEKAIQGLLGEAKDVKPAQLKAALDALKIASEEELYEEVGLGNRMAFVVAQQFQKVDENLVEETTAEKEQELEDTLPLSIRGTEGVVIEYAKCCRPIPGDYIVGYLQAGAGMIVHDEQCPNLIKLRQTHPDQCVVLNWEEEMQGDFQVDVRVEALNKTGMLANVSQALAQLGVSIHHFSAAEDGNQYCHLDLTLSVQSRKHLADIFRRVRHEAGVIKIQRVYH